MLYGMLAGFFGAFLNSLGYLSGVIFLSRYKDAGRMLVMAAQVMMLLSLPLVIWMFPFEAVREHALSVWGKVILTDIIFLVGQSCFYMAISRFEASRISSLLGLKIIVLSVMFIALGNTLGIMQISAVVIAAAAAFVFNWSGKEPVPAKAWILLIITLLSYSLVDIVQTKLIAEIVDCSQLSKLHSSIVGVSMIYLCLGIVTMPALFFYRPNLKQFILIFPFSVLWLVSQYSVLFCYSLLQPVFGNVILATRGIFSVLLGAVAVFFGFKKLDSDIPASLWIRRGIAALMMLGAIALYSFGSAN